MWDCLFLGVFRENHAGLDESFHIRPALKILAHNLIPSSSILQRPWNVAAFISVTSDPRPLSGRDTTSNQQSTPGHFGKQISGRNDFWEHPFWCFYQKERWRDRELNWASRWMCSKTFAFGRVRPVLKLTSFITQRKQTYSFEPKHIIFCFNIKWFCFNSHHNRFQTVYL